MDQTDSLMEQQLTATELWSDMIIFTSVTPGTCQCKCHHRAPSVNKEYLSQIQLYSIFGELTVLSNTVLIITVCVKVANSTFLVTNKRTK